MMLQELKAQRNRLAKEGERLAQKKGVTAGELEAKRKEIQNIDAKIETLNLIGDTAPVKKGLEAKDEGKYRNYVRSGEMRNLLTDIPGDYQVENDYLRKVEELQRGKFDIRKYIDVVETSFTRGTKPFQRSKAGVLKSTRLKEEAQTGQPVLYPVDYDIKTFIGFTDVSDELLEDSEKTTMDFLLNWFSQHSLNTYAYQVFNGAGGENEAAGIFTEAKTGGSLEDRVRKQETAPTLQEFRKTLNKDLKGLINSQKKIFTNSTGFNYLEGIGDSSCKTSVYPDSTKESGWAFSGRELVEVPDEFFPDTEDGTPFIVGDLKSLYKMIKYSDMSLESSGYTENGWQNSISEAKGTVKFDGVVSEDKETVIILFSKLA